MRRLLGLLAVGVLAAAAALAYHVYWRDGERVAQTPPQTVMSGRFLLGFQDDVAFRWSEDRAALLDEARDAGAGVIRTVVDWSVAAPERPATPRDGLDPAYAVDDLDELARNAQARGIELLISIWGTPSWANRGRGRNHAPDDPADLRAFAHALADRYSGRHAGYPAVRLFSAWNEPNLEQFLAPQFDSSGRSVAPAIYARIARAVYEGVKEANPAALVAIGETSPRGHDRPGGAGFQDSHSPPRFARLLAEQPDVPFDAWAQHPYPTRPDVAPAASVRWPRVGIANLGRFGEWLDEHFGEDEIPVWITEYAHETVPDPIGVSLELQASYLEDALTLAADDPRVRMFLWFIFRDTAGEPWQSGLVGEDGTDKPALARYAALAPGFDARDPVVANGVDVVRLPVLELAYHNAVGSALTVTVGRRPPLTTELDSDGWIDVPLPGGTDGALPVRVADASGNAVRRVVLVAPS